jgi:hypothetical protein
MQAHVMYDHTVYIPYSFLHAHVDRSSRAKVMYDHILHDYVMYDHTVHAYPSMTMLSLPTSCALCMPVPCMNMVCIPTSCMTIQCMLQLSTTTPCIPLSCTYDHALHAHIMNCRTVLSIPRMTTLFTPASYSKHATPTLCTTRSCAVHTHPSLFILHATCNVQAYAFWKYPRYTCQRHDGLGSTYQYHIHVLQRGAYPRHV